MKRRGGFPQWWKEDLPVIRMKITHSIIGHPESAVVPFNGFILKSMCKECGTYLYNAL